MRRARAFLLWAMVAAPVAVVVPAPAFAWPVDVVRTLTTDREQFQRLAALAWSEVADPSIATAEFVPETGELILTGKKPGSTLLLLYAEGRFAVWRLEVTGRSKPPPNDAAARAVLAKACGKLPDGPGLALTIRDERCRKAALDFFKTDAVLASELEVTFDVAALQAQLAAIQSAIAKVTPKPVTARYVGAGLELRGTLTAAEHRKVLWAIFENTAGRPAIDDGIEIEDSADAGVQR